MSPAPRKPRPVPRPLAGLAARAVGAGEPIFREGDDPRGEAFLVQAGRVEIRKRVGGRDRAIRVLPAGELVGELALFRETPHSASAVALEPTTVLVIPAARLVSLVRSRPALAVALIRQLAERLREAEERPPSAS